MPQGRLHAVDDDDGDFDEIVAFSKDSSVGFCCSYQNVTCMVNRAMARTWFGDSWTRPRHVRFDFASKYH